MNIRIALLLALCCATSFGATAIGVDQAADVVLGQTDFVSKLAPATATATSLNTPASVAVDPTSGKVFVADTNNNRVLRYDSVAAMTSGASAEAFFGQASVSGNGAATTPKEMSAPFGVAVDQNGTLWVADSGNNRVLRFDNAAAKPAFAINADGVLGQPDLSTKTVLTPPTQASMNGPRAVTVDANDTLWVTDFSNNRVLRFDGAAGVINGANADGVLGAPSFTVNFGGVTTQYAMNGPDGIATDSSGHLWVADFNNSRVLRFDDAANLPNGALAASVLGQPDFLTSTASAVPTAASLNHPTGLAMSADDSLWVSDGLNSRVLRFDNAAKKASDAGANSVLGQVDFVTKGSTTTQTGIAAAFGLALDATGALWVADTLNHRILHYTPKTKTVTSTIAGVILSVSGKKKILTSSAKIVIKGSAACADGVARVEYRIGSKGAFKAATGTTTWHFTAKLKLDANAVSVRAISTKGAVSAPATLKAIRQ
jgi:sugar lactone lactonase YvrE